MPELRDKPEYETPLLREERRDEISAIICSWLKDRNMEDVFHAAQELRMPLTTVPNMSQIMETRQHKERGYFVEIDHPATGPLKYPGAPFKLGETPWRAGRAPLLGEHNEEVYCSRMGLTRDDLARLGSEAVI